MPTYFEWTGGARQTSVVGTLNASATSIVVADGTGYPTGAGGRQFVIGIGAENSAGYEKVLCDSRSGNTITVNASGRGYDGTTATTHANGDPVNHVWNAVAATDATEHVNDETLDDHPQYLKVYSAKAYGATAGGVADDTAEVQAAIDATPAGGRCFLPDGSYLVDQLDIPTAIRFGGAGKAKTIIKAKTGATGPLLNFAPASTKSFTEVDGFTIDMTNATGVVAANLTKTDSPYVHDVAVIGGGTVGLDMADVGGGAFERIYTRGQTISGVRLDGDAGGENRFTDIDIAPGSGVTMAVGFDVSRTTATDVGGLYLKRVKVTTEGGTVTRGIRVSSSATTTDLPVIMEDCVADGAATYSAVFKNIRMIRVVHSWLSGARMQLDATIRTVLANNYFGVGVELANAPDRTSLLGNFFPGAGAALTLSGGAPNYLFFGPDNFYAGTLGADAAAEDVLTVAQSGNRRSLPFDVLTSDTTGRFFSLLNASTGKKKSFRVNSSATGTLQVVNDAGTTVIWELSDAGVIGVGATGSATIRKGAGSPEGVVTAVVGSLFLRTDGGATTTLYVKESGASNTGWVAK